MKLEVWNFPNSAGVVIDAVRSAKLALDRGIGGVDRTIELFHEVTAPAVFRPSGARPHRTFIYDEEHRGDKVVARLAKAR